MSELEWIEINLKSGTPTESSTFHINQSILLRIKEYVLSIYKTPDKTFFVI